MLTWFTSSCRQCGEEFHTTSVNVRYCRRCRASLKPKLARALSIMAPRVYISGLLNDMSCRCCGRVLHFSAVEMGVSKVGGDWTLLCRRCFQLATKYTLTELRQVVSFLEARES